MNDGQCRVARTDLIWHRFEVQKQPTEINKIKEFELVTAYKKCLELAAQIETIDQSKLQERRFIDNDLFFVLRRRKRANRYKQNYAYREKMNKRVFKNSHHGDGARFVILRQHTRLARYKHVPE